jgi:anti-sigma factor RsiW
VTEHWDEYSDLLGAYALDAVDEDERDRLELHLLECPRCRSEVSEHREVAAYLANSGAQAPDDVWDRIVAELAPPAPPLRLAVSTPSADPVVRPISEAPSRRATSPRRAVVAIVGVAACIVAALGFLAVGQSNRLDRLESAMETRSMEAIATDAVASAEVVARMEGPAGTAEAVVDSGGQGFLIMSEVPSPADGSVYQLWGKVDETVLSLGTFGGGTTVVPFSVDPARLDNIELFAITEEKAPGVVASEQDPVMAGTV